MEFDCARLFVDEICWISPPTGVLCQKKFSGQASWEANCGMNAIYCKPRIGRVENRDCLTWEWIIPRSFISLITFVATDHTKGRTKKFKLKNFTKFNYRRPFGRVRPQASVWRLKIICAQWEVHIENHSPSQLVQVFHPFESPFQRWRPLSTLPSTSNVKRRLGLQISRG